MRCIALCYIYITWHLRKIAGLWVNISTEFPGRTGTQLLSSFPKGKPVTSQFAVRNSFASFSGRQVSGDTKLSSSNNGRNNGRSPSQPTYLLRAWPGDYLVPLWPMVLSSINLLPLGSQAWVTINLLPFDPWTYYEPTNLIVKSTLNNQLPFNLSDVSSALSSKYGDKVSVSMTW